MNLVSNGKDDIIHYSVINKAMPNIFYPLDSNPIEFTRCFINNYIFNKIDPIKYPRMPCFSYILCKNGKKMLCDIHLDETKFISTNY